MKRIFAWAQALGLLMLFAAAGASDAGSLTLAQTALWIGLGALLALAGSLLCRPRRRASGLRGAQAAPAAALTPRDAA